MPSRADRNRARQLRRAATEAERLLWFHLRRSLPLEGTYFRRQVALGRYFADFCCFSRRLIIELDGSQHGHTAIMMADAKRTRFLEEHGYRVLRFWNHQVHNEIEGVLETIMAALSDSHP